MNNLRFLADVHISPLTVAALKLHGYDILRSTDLLPATAADIDILELARVEGRYLCLGHAARTVSFANA